MWMERKSVSFFEKDSRPMVGHRKEDTLMYKHTSDVTTRQTEEGTVKSLLEAMIREGAQRMLQLAVEVEVEEYIQSHAGLVDEATGHRVVVGNGKGYVRHIQTGLGPIEVRQPRVHDRRKGKKFTSRILPPYMRRIPSIEALIPLLYLKGVSTKDLPEILRDILGESTAGISASTIVRLTEVWGAEYEEWRKRDLRGKRYVYFWVDGVYFNVRLTDERPCLLVIVGALPDGTKELVAIHDGERESKMSWVEVLRDLKRRGLEEAPSLATGDGALGFWGALAEVYPKTRKQRCWVHKTANILDKMPKKVQPGAKALIHEMYLAGTKAEALEAYEEFVSRYGAKYPKAVECLVKDKEELFTFYDFPAEHWVHIRTTNVIESLFATVKHRHRQTKGSGSRRATLGMVYKLSREAEKHWRKLNASVLLSKVMAGVKFIDGEEDRSAA